MTGRSDDECEAMNFCESKGDLHEQSSSTC